MFSEMKQAFSQSQSVIVQTKNSTPFTSFVQFLTYNGWSNLASYQCMLYYTQVSPLFDSIYKIAKEAASVMLYTQDIKSEKYANNHPILDVLRNPNTDMIRTEFMEQLVSYFLITGNCYVVATGAYKQPPLELYAVSPAYITLIADNRDGWIKTINYNSNQRSITFTREIVDGRFRYFSPDFKQEIYSIRSFNPFRGFNNNYGLSILSPIYYEIEQYIKASVHNLSLLNRGARPSGALSTEETLSDESFARMQQQMDVFTAGADNAGRILLLDNGVKFQEMGLSNKDMDFVKLKESLRLQMYNTFNIPLALIATGTMSYNNLETARLMLYDFAVLPILKRILEELSNFVMYRYGEQDKTAISYNEDSIPALQLRRNEQLLLRKNINVNSINEIRELMGDKPVINGDDIYSNGAGYPIARVGGELEQEEQAESSPDEGEIEKSLKLDYIMRAKYIKNKDGIPAFNDEQLNKMAIQYGL